MGDRAVLQPVADLSGAPAIGASLQGMDVAEIVRGTDQYLHPIDASTLIRACGCQRNQSEGAKQPLLLYWLTVVCVLSGVGRAGRRGGFGRRGQTVVVGLCVVVERHLSCPHTPAPKRWATNRHVQTITP